MWAGVGKSGSPISRWMMLRPCASSARAFTSTSKADSTPMRLMRSASFIQYSALWSLRFSKARHAAAALDFRHAVADRHTRAMYAGGHAAAAVEGDDGGLIRRLVQESFRRGVNDGFGVNGSGPHAAPRMLTTQVAPLPPRFSARPSACRASWRSPASPRI